jgi:hypothetical protein
MPNPKEAVERLTLIARKWREDRKAAVNRIPSDDGPAWDAFAAKNPVDVNINDLWAVIDLAALFVKQQEFSAAQAIARSTEGEEPVAFEIGSQVQPRDGGLVHGEIIDFNADQTGALVRWNTGEEIWKALRNLEPYTAPPPAEIGATVEEISALIAAELRKQTARGEDNPSGTWTEGYIDSDQIAKRILPRLSTSAGREVVELLRDAREMLSEAQSGYIPHSAEALEWDGSRESLTRKIATALSAAGGV